jgi:hypothetical protein
MRIGVTHYVKLNKVFENIFAVSKECLLSGLIEKDLSKDIHRFHEYLLESDSEKALLQLERIRSDIVDIDAFLENFRIIITEYKEMLIKGKEEEETEGESEEEVHEATDQI